MKKKRLASPLFDVTLLHTKIPKKLSQANRYSDGLFLTSVDVIPCRTESSCMKTAPGLPFGWLCSEKTLSIQLFGQSGGRRKIPENPSWLAANHGNKPLMSSQITAFRKGFAIATPSWLDVVTRLPHTPWLLGR